jgi:hypothetical protein
MKENSALWPQLTGPCKEEMCTKYKMHNSAQSSTRGSGKEGFVKVFIGLKSAVSHLNSSAKRFLRPSYKKLYKPHSAILSTIMFRGKPVCVFENNNSESYLSVTISTMLSQFLIRDQQGDLITFKRLIKYGLDSTCPG